jgi:hypothetical protein
MFGSDKGRIKGRGCTRHCISTGDGVKSIESIFSEVRDGGDVEGVNTQGCRGALVVRARATDRQRAAITGFRVRESFLEINLVVSKCKVQCTGGE